MQEPQQPSSSTIEVCKPNLKRCHSEEHESETETKKKKGEETVVSDEECQEIAKKLSNEWKDLGICLGFTVNEIENLERDHGNCTILYKITCMLSKWRKRTELPGRRMKLAAALKKIRRNDIAEYVTDIKHSGKPGVTTDFVFNRMLMEVEDSFTDSLLKQASRLLRVGINFNDAEMLTQYLQDNLGLRRSNVCILQALLHNLKCKELQTAKDLVEDYGRQNDHVIFLFESEPVQGESVTRVKFKLKCSPVQLSYDEQDALLTELEMYMGIDVACVVKGVSEGCTCLTVDIPNACIPQIRVATLEKSPSLINLGIFNVNIDGEDYPDLCYFEDESQMTSLFNLSSEIIKRGIDSSPRRSPVFFPNIYDSQKQGQSCQNSVCSSTERSPTPVQTSIVPPRGAVVKTALKNILSAKYKDLDDLEPNVGNPILHTLSNNYVEIELKTKEGRSVKMENGKGKLPRKVLIQGRTGFGKTTFCKKLVHDWATSRNVVFGSKIPFFLKVNEINLDTTIPTCQEGILRQAIFPRLVPMLVNGNLTQDDIWLFIQSNSSEFVFVLDGLSEASEEVLIALCRLINGDYLPDSTILVTSTTEDLQNDVKFDSHLVLEGFSESQIKKCVKNSFKTRSGDEDLFLKEIKESNLMELMECPLFTVLLSLMWQEASYRKTHHRLPSTKTDILTQFCMFLVRRYDRKEKGRKAVLYDSVQDMPQSYINIMINIGKVALDSLKSNSHIIKLDHEDGIIAEQIGLITKSTIVTPLKVIPSYVGTHKFMLEYLAAFYLKNTSEPYPIQLLMFKNMKMVAMFLTGLLDIDDKSSELLKSFVEDSVQNYNLTVTCLEECRPINKQRVLKFLGNIVSQHTYLDLGFIGKGNTGALELIYSMIKEATPATIKVLKVEASGVFIRGDHSAVIFAKLVKCFPKLIAITFPRFMLPSQICSIINELKRGSSKRRCTLLQKISLVSDIHSNECSEKVVEMLTLFPRLDEIELLVKMNAVASSRFLKGVCHQITERANFLEDAKVLDLSLLTLKIDKDCENILTIFSELRNLERLIVPRQVVKMLYPRHYRNVMVGKYILHKMPLLPNVKLSMFLQIDIDKSTENPKSTGSDLSYNPLSFSELFLGVLSVPEFNKFNASFHKRSKNTVCDLLETNEGSLVLTYWNDVLGHQRALNRDEVMKLCPSAVCLHSIGLTSGNAIIVAELVSQIMVEKVILNDLSCASLSTFYKLGSVTMDGITTADLTECTVAEKAAEAILIFPNLKTISMAEKLNPVSLLEELTNSEGQLELDLQKIYLSCSPESSYEVLKSVSIQFNDALVSPSAITLKTSNCRSAFRNISIVLERNPTLLTNLPWVNRIQFEGDSCAFLKKFSLLLDRSKDCFKHVRMIQFKNEEFIDKLSNAIMNDIKTKIAETSPLFKNVSTLTFLSDYLMDEDTNLQYPSSNDGDSYQYDVSTLKSLDQLYDEVYLSRSELRLTKTSFKFITDSGEDTSSLFAITVKSDPKLLIELPHIRKLTIKPTSNELVLFKSWVRALETFCTPDHYKYLQILDLNGTRFRSNESLQLLSKVMEYTPKLSTIINAKVAPRFMNWYRQFLIENKLVSKTKTC